MVAPDLNAPSPSDPPTTPPSSAPPAALTVLYDERCSLCERAKDWLRTQQLLVPMELLPAGSPVARRRYGQLPWRGQELVVTAPDGRVWIGPSAFLMCLWATRRYRPWAYRLNAPTLAPLARRFFTGLSARRSAIGALARAVPVPGLRAPAAPGHGGSGVTEVTMPRAAGDGSGGSPTGT